MAGRDELIYAVGATRFFVGASVTFNLSPTAFCVYRRIFNIGGSFSLVSGATLSNALGVPVSTTVADNIAFWGQANLWLATAGVTATVGLIEGFSPSSRGASIVPG